MLVAAMNPCPCGFYGDPTRECRCTPAIIQRYLAKVSGPLLDRIDLHIEVPAVPYKELRSNDNGVTSTQMRERINRAREIQHVRGFYNSQIPARQLRTLCALDDAGERTLEMAVRRMSLSARAHDRVLKVARTIADLSVSERVTGKHLAEAVQYRSLDRSYWKYRRLSGTFFCGSPSTTQNCLPSSERSPDCQNHQLSRDLKSCEPGSLQASPSLRSPAPKPTRPAMSRRYLGALILEDTVLDVIRRELRRLSLDVKIDRDELR
jgi:hypothetical protein